MGQVKRAVCNVPNQNQHTWNHSLASQTHPFVQRGITLSSEAQMLQFSITLYPLGNILYIRSYLPYIHTYNSHHKVHTHHSTPVYITEWHKLVRTQHNIHTLLVSLSQTAFPWWKRFGYARLYTLYAMLHHTPHTCGRTDGHTHARTHARTHTHLHILQPYISASMHCVEQQVIQETDKR